MDIYVALRDQRTVKLSGCTGNPTEVSVNIQDGYYRDIFSLTQSNDGLYYPGVRESEGQDNSMHIEAPLFVSGGIVPTGNVVISKLPFDVESRISIESFNVAVSDEVAHAPLRQVEYKESYWAFPVTNGNVSMNMMFRQAVVDGWGNEPPTF